MIVVDASALVDWLLVTPGPGPAIGERMLAAQPVHTLELAFAQVLSAFRQRVRGGALNAERAEAALALLGAAPFRRHVLAPLTGRIWRLRASLSAYDAAYVALAEALGAPLLTTDRRLARSTGHGARILCVAT